MELVDLSLISSISERAQEKLAIKPWAFQLETTKSVLNGNDTVAIAPTGAGKSLNFTLPFLGCTNPDTTMIIIITPLKALQTDQTRTDHEAIYINEDNIFDEVVDMVRRKEFRRIFLAPEQLTGGAMRKLVKNPEWNKDVLAYVIDEAHVVVEWGGTFRPTYETLSDLRHISGSRRIPILATSATLPIATFDTLCDKLEMSDPTVINIGSSRPNIFLKVVTFKKKSRPFSAIYRQLEELKSLKPGDPPSKLKKTIIYINDKREIKRLRKRLRKKLEPFGLQDCVHYHHATATADHRSMAEDRFKKGELRWIIATDALGMGANIRDIHRVIQVRAGETASAFLQRVGRAGRDGISQCEGILLLESGLLKEGSEQAGAKKGGAKNAKWSINEDWLAMLRDTDTCLRSLLAEYHKGPDSTVDFVDDRPIPTGYPCCSRCNAKAAATATTVSATPTPTATPAAATQPNIGAAAPQQSGAQPKAGAPRKSDELVVDIEDSLLDWVDGVWAHRSSMLSGMAGGRDGIMEGRQARKIAQMALRWGRNLSDREFDKELLVVADGGLRAEARVVVADCLREWDEKQAADTVAAGEGKKLLKQDLIDLRNIWVADTVRIQGKWDMPVQ